MSANTTPIFVKKPNDSVPVFSAAANLASDGSGALIPLVTGAVDGTRVDQVNFRNAQVTPAASSAMLVKVFLSNTSGANSQLVGELNLAATTRSGTLIGANGSIVFSPALILRSGQVLSVCQSVYAGVQDRLAFWAIAGDF